MIGFAAAAALTFCTATADEVDSEGVVRAFFRASTTETMAARITSEAEIQIDGKALSFSEFLNTHGSGIPFDRRPISFVQEDRELVIVRAPVPRSEGRELAIDRLSAKLVMTVIVDAGCIERITGQTEAAQ